MSTDIKDMTDTVEEVAFGAAETAAEIASNPMGAVRRQVKGLERKGTPAARKANRRFNAQLNYATAPAKDAFKTISKTAEKVAGELAPEKVVIKGLRLVKGFEAASELIPVSKPAARPAVTRRRRISRRRAA
ncbi:MAG: hypothetical protein E6I69_04990 [Chloroflexi bacterium]|nr:MAG: hypothetical protein E6I69_04990 [Chloroflexota bacterium]